MTGDPGPLVGYVGWRGKGNLGDDAIYDAVRSQIPGATFIDFPRVPHEMMGAAVTGLNRSLRRSTQVVGGGTLIGRRHWRRLITRGMTLTRGRGSYAIGVGVEDPVFIGRKSGSADGELKRWAAILSEFNTVSVRGPRSAELLSGIGLSVEVSGDPALLLPRPKVTAEDGLIGVNLGFGDDLWGHNPRMVAREVSSALRNLYAQGYRFVGILMNAADRRWTEMALGDIPTDIVCPVDANAAAEEFGRCSTAIVSRLHAGILAALSSTPMVALEYQPKCRDFALSIDNERSLIRTDQLASATVVDRVCSSLADAPIIRSKTHAAVSRLRHRLRANYHILAHQLGLGHE